MRSDVETRDNRLKRGKGTEGDSDGIDSIRREDNEEEDMLVSQLNMDVSNQYVVFSVGDEEYGIPILSVQEIISMPHLTRVPGVPKYIPGIINLRGNIIPIYVLRSKFDLTLENLDGDTIVVWPGTYYENLHLTTQTAPWDSSSILFLMWLVSPKRR